MLHYSVSEGLSLIKNETRRLTMGWMHILDSVEKPSTGRPLLVATVAAFQLSG